MATNDQLGKSDEHLVLSAQFHSRQHKHADDLTLNYCVKGHPYLIDAGTFTYHYDQLERMYIESTKAHNTIEIDGLNNSRFRLDAYGSGLSKVFQIGNCTVMEAKIDHKNLVPKDIPNNVIKTTGFQKYKKKDINIESEYDSIYNESMKYYAYLKEVK